MATNSQKPKIVGEGLTYDDVLLIPAYPKCSHATSNSRATSPEHHPENPGHLRGYGHGDGQRYGHAMARQGGIVSSTRT